jgi:hypothetical protein
MQYYVDERFCIPEVVPVIFLGDPDCRLDHCFERIFKANISFCIVISSVPAIEANPSMIQNIIPRSFRMSPEVFEAILGGVGVIL